MDDLKRTCPACNLIFAVTRPDDAVPCPMCGTTVTPPAPVPATTPVPALAGSRRAGGMAAALVALSVLGAGIGLALPDAGRPAKPPGPPPAPPAPAVTASIPDLPPEDDVKPPPLPPPTLPAPTPPPRVRLARPMPRPVRPTAPRPVASHRFLDERVNQAIDQGVAYLKQHAGEVPLPVRYDGLMGLALLECGVSRGDPAVRRIAASLRKQAPTLNRTYELALAILFFDRLGSDRNLIRLFADRLAAGQEPEGGWSYQSPSPRKARPPAVTMPWNRKARTKAVRRTVAMRYRSDQSNSQFAVLALWVAQRHGAYVRIPLSKVDRYFRHNQKDNGGWAYRHYAPVPTLANTCAGLLALAAGHGISARTGRDASLPFRFRMEDDPAVAAAFRFAGAALYEHSRPALLFGAGGPRGILLRVPHNFYTLWSVERVAVIFGLKKLGGREWYPPVAESILQLQAEDGSWPGGYGAPVNTAFALLVLRRSNLAPDLTETLTGRKPEPPVAGPETAPEPQPGLTEKPEPRLPSGKAVPAGDSPPGGKAVPAPPGAGGKAHRTAL